MTFFFAFFTGCALDLGTDYGDVLPDDRLAIDLPAAGASAARSADEYAQFYLLTAQVTGDVNDLIGDVLRTVDRVTDHRPTTFDRETSTATWGPFSDALDPFELQLTVQHHVDTDEYSWAIQAWPRGDEAAASSLAAGEVDAGATREASSGRFFVDFDAVATADPTESGSGRFGVEYDLRPDGAAATAAFEEATDEDLDALYVYDQVLGGEGMMDLAIRGDVHVTPSGLEEILVVRSRWQADGAGRSDVLITEGDLGEEVAEASECWDADFARVYYDDDSGIGVEEGSPSDCVFRDADFAG